MVKLGLDFTSEMGASLAEIAAREGITPVQALRNALGIERVYEGATAPPYETGYVPFSPRDQRQLARMPWL